MHIYEDLSYIKIMFRIIDNSSNNISNQNMWGIKESIYKRQFNVLRSAQQKYARRCNWEKMMHVSLEMAASGCSRAAYDYLSTLMVEDKFPAGAELLHNHQYVLKQWKKVLKNQQYLMVEFLIQLYWNYSPNMVLEHK